jgi:hypothetical protein
MVNKRVNGVIDRIGGRAATDASSTDELIDAMDAHSVSSLLREHSRIILYVLTISGLLAWGQQYILALLVLLGGGVVMCLRARAQSIHIAKAGAKLMAEIEAEVDAELDADDVEFTKRYLDLSKKLAAQHQAGASRLSQMQFLISSDRDMMKTMLRVSGVLDDAMLDEFIDTVMNAKSMEEITSVMTEDSEMLNLVRQLAELDKPNLGKTDMLRIPSQPETDIQTQAD